MGSGQYSGGWSGKMTSYMWAVLPTLASEFLPLGKAS